MKTEKGRIIKSNGGFYTVETPCGVYVCKARGIFRLKNISPMTNDIVTVQLDEGQEPLITDIDERKNEIVRPPIANLDIAVLVVSTCQPAPNTYVIDKLIAIFESKGIEPVLCFTKKDIADSDKYMRIYEKAGFRCFAVDNTSGDGADTLMDYLDGKCVALIGNSGVGKSSLMNILLPELKAETSEISKKLGRGRHTTREVNLYHLGSGYCADTPGFSTVEIGRYGNIPSAELQNCFREMSEYMSECRFANCVHIGEHGCAVKAAVGAGEISQSRYENYIRIYGEAKTAENTY